MKKLWIGIARLFGWQYDIEGYDQRPELRHCVMIEAPHTSIYDFLLGASCVWKMGLNARFFIKKEFFVFPLRHILRWCGAIPVDRGNHSNHLVDKAVDTLQKNPDFTIIITPEGTRKRVKRLKRGFYEIATRAGVPIVITYIDYRTRHMGLGPTIVPTGDYHADMQRILAAYEGVTARNPEGWDLPALKQSMAPTLPHSGDNEATAAHNTEKNKTIIQ